ncbi:hypothetical protein C8R44DRAFT_744974 [Mycena epipterygia]|nr:hypothetical protein C8R44DRAFT_744974 [Mycena epipterygia]
MLQAGTGFLISIRMKPPGPRTLVPKFATRKSRYVKWPADEPPQCTSYPPSNPPRPDYRTVALQHLRRSARFEPGPLAQTQAGVPVAATHWHLDKPIRTVLLRLSPRGTCCIQPPGSVPLGRLSSRLYRDSAFIPSLVAVAVALAAVPRFGRYWSSIGTKLEYFLGSKY